MFNNNDPITDDNQLPLQEIQAISENGNGSYDIYEKSSEKMLEALNYSDTRPIAPTNNEAWLKYKTIYTLF